MQHFATVPHYELSAELQGHESDVRAVCVVPGQGFATASRDRTARVWHWEDKGWTLHRVLSGHQHFVSAAVALPPGSSQREKGGLATGSNDGLIHVWDIESAEPEMTLVGHEKPVSSLAPMPNGGLLVSGSWDSTARVWRGADCVQELRGHTQAVWAVLPLPSSDILTASADKTIKLWRDGKCIHTYQGHTDVVRALQPLEGVGFLSASNDGSLRVWTLGGECVGEYHGHDSFIFSIAVVPASQLIASASEDHTVKLWQGDKCVQTLQHPSTVWSVSALENGDIVTGCSDGVARVWSARPDAALPPTELTAYYNRVTNVPVPKGSIGDLNMEKLPGTEALEVPGRAEGERRIVRNGNRAEVYMWDSAQSQWTKFGEVVDAASAPAKSIAHGREYDYVFDVDLGDGHPPRKLGYNANENPWVVAQEFLWREELSQYYLDEVARFIMANSSPISLSQAGQGNQDPLTGGAGDPFTGSSSYHTPAVSQALPSSGSVSSTPPATVTSGFTYFPNRVMVYFDQSNFEGILKKLREFSAQLSTSQDASKAWSQDGKEAVAVECLIKTLKETSRYHASSFNDQELRVVRKMLTWPSPLRFPVLDLVRSMALHPVGAAYFSRPEAWQELETVLLDSLWDNTVVPNTMLALRVLANLFNTKSSRDVVLQHAETLLEAAADAARSSNKNIRLSLATLLLNFSVQLQDMGSGFEGKMQVISILAEMLGPESEDEVMYSALVALGTLASNDPAIQGLAKDLEIPSNLRRCNDGGKHTSKTRAATAEILQLVLPSWRFWLVLALVQVISQVGKSLNMAIDERIQLLEVDTWSFLPLTLVLVFCSLLSSVFRRSRCGVLGEGGGSHLPMIVW